MYAQKTHHVDHELLKWFVLIVLTLLLVLFTTRSSGAETVEPTLFAATVKTDVAQPIGEVIQQQPTHRIESHSRDKLRRQIPTARRLWEIFELHEKREFEEAIGGWHGLSLFDCDVPWRAIAVGQAYLQLGDLDDAVRRLQAFEKVGADVLYAPGLVTMDDVNTVMGAVTKPVNVLATTELRVADLGAAGVRRVSLGGSLFRAAVGGLMRTVREIVDEGTFTDLKNATSGRDIVGMLK